MVLNFHLGTKKLIIVRASCFQKKIKFFLMEGPGVWLRKKKFALSLS